MLKNKSIQMDVELINEIEKRMVKTRNFSFQAVTRDLIKSGLKATELQEKKEIMKNGEQQRDPQSEIKS